MISRKTTLLIDRVYGQWFSQITDSIHNLWIFDTESMYTHFYAEGYDDWFLRCVKNLDGDATAFQELIQGLHTGKSVTKTSHPALSKAVGQLLLKRLAEDALRVFHPAIETSDVQFGEVERESIEALVNQLALDGHVFSGGKLYPIEPGAVDPQQEQSYLELLINRVALSNPQLIVHHLELSEQAYAESRWNDTISNARNFLESILNQVADKLHQKLHGSSLPPKIAAWPKDVRAFLESEKFIDSTEKEALAKVYGLLSNTGSHPNIAQRDQARLMRTLALTFSQYVLLQWEGYLKNNP